MGELGPNKLFIFFVRGYLERYKVGSPNVRYGNPGDSMTKDRGDIGGPLGSSSLGQSSRSGSHVSSPFCVRGTTGFERLGHGVDVDGGVVGRGQVEGAICPKGGASQSMMAAWRRQLLRRIVLCEWREHHLPKTYVQTSWSM